MSRRELDLRHFKRLTARRSICPSFLEKLFCPLGTDFKMKNVCCVKNEEKKTEEFEKCLKRAATRFPSIIALIVP